MITTILRVHVQMPPVANKLFQLLTVVLVIVQQIQHIPVVAAAAAAAASGSSGITNNKFAFIIDDVSKNKNHYIHQQQQQQQQQHYHYQFRTRNTLERTSKRNTVLQLNVVKKLLSVPPPPPPPPPLPLPQVQVPTDSNVVLDTITTITTTLQQQMNDIQTNIVSLLDFSKLDTTSILPVKLLQQQIDNLQSSVVNTIDTLQSSIQQQISNINTDGSFILNSEFVTSLSKSVSSIVLPIISSIQNILQTIDTTVVLSAIPTPIIFIATTIVTYLVSSTVIRLLSPDANKEKLLTTPYPNDNRYDPYTAQQYFDQRLLLVLSRTITIAIQSLQFGIKVYLDTLRSSKNGDNVNTEQEQLIEEQRGIELAQLLTKLGPTFIKVGQSLSIRTDLLSPAYIRGLTTLQDQVPPFDTTIASQILLSEWNSKLNIDTNNNKKTITLDDILVDGKLSDKPIAAASLGQVYKAVLKDSGETIAIKIQRPNIVEQIALDMYLVREFASFAKRFFNLNTDTVGTVDAWGIGFINELDYIAEATNGIVFNEQIQKTPLKNVVFSPTIVQDYTTKSILVSNWVDGERLDKSNSNDVTVLCSIAMNTYLTMLLEFGTLHCDPHPGNLLRTMDGKLCILDWGMVTSIDSELQLTLIEHMAHLTSADYNELPRDLLLLGFIEPSKASLIESSGIVDVLGSIYGAWTAGGGAATIDVNKVINQLQDLTLTNGNIFQIPPYFAYIAKSFSVLEGIGLSNQPGTYSIINECLPYISKRLISDTDTMGPALSTFIFGPEKYNKDRIINYKRVRQLVEGFTQYTTSTSSITAIPAAAGEMLVPVNDNTVSATEPAAAVATTTTATTTSSTTSQVQQLEEITDQVLDLIFSVNETPVQEIILEQVAKIVSSNSRYALTLLRERSGILPTGRTVLGSLIDPFGLFRTSPLFRVNELDEQTVIMTQQLLQLVDDIRIRQIEQSEKTRLAQINAGIPVSSTPTSSSSSSSSSTSSTSLSQFGFNLTSEESIEFIQLLITKIWNKRDGIVLTSNRFIRTLLTITADQLERGERDTRRIKSLSSTTTSSPLPTTESTTTTANSEVSSSTASIPTSVTLPLSSATLNVRETSQQQQQQQQQQKLVSEPPLVMATQTQSQPIVVENTMLDTGAAVMATATATATAATASIPFARSSLSSSRLETARQLLSSYQQMNNDNFDSTAYNTATTTTTTTTAMGTATMDNVFVTNNDNESLLSSSSSSNEAEFEQFRQTLLE